MENGLTAKLKASAPGQTAEETNSATGTAGLYRHPISGAEVITLSDPLYGDAQSEAAIRVGFVRVRDVQPEEIVQINLVQEVTNNRSTGLANSSDDIKGLLARVNAQDAEIARLKGNDPTANQVTEVPGGEQAKVDGANAVAAQASTTDVAPVQNVAPGDGVGGDTSTTPPVPAPETASQTGGAQPAPTEPVGGPATGQPVAPTPSTDGVKDAGSVEAQAASAAAAAGEPTTAPEAPVAPADASNATPVADDGQSADDSEDNTPDGASTLPLTEQSTDELKETASAEGLDVTNLSTNEDLIAAIEAKRAESEK